MSILTLRPRSAAVSVSLVVAQACVVGGRTERSTTGSTSDGAPVRGSAPPTVSTAPPGEGETLDVVPAVVMGGGRMCSLSRAGEVRCWGNNAQGNLGYGDRNNRQPKTSAPIPLGGRAVQLKAGVEHTCALLVGGQVKCWGQNDVGQLGSGTTQNIGVDEPPSVVDAVDVGAKVTHIETGAHHTCVIVDDGGVRCWGDGREGALGYSRWRIVGREESPASLGAVHLGGRAIQLAAGSQHTCALLADGLVKCWGRNTEGQLGIGLAHDTKPGRDPSDNTVRVGEKAVAIAAGDSHTCALLEGGRMRCWGENSKGQLGYGAPREGKEKNQDIHTALGGLKRVAPGGDIRAARDVVKMALGYSYTCVLLEGGGVRCWGGNFMNELGYPELDHPNRPGDDWLALPTRDVDVGGAALDLFGQLSDSCVLLAEDRVRCWGTNNLGELGEDTPDERPLLFGALPQKGVVFGATDVKAW